MAVKTGIEWTDATWNPIRGCSRVSEGCRNCYAETIAARFSHMLPGSEGPVYQPFFGFADAARSGSKWTGSVELVESALTEPLHWRKPARIFVNSMSDLFHENLPDEAIDRVFSVMALCPRHTFQVLTKRPDRMLHVMTKVICTQKFWSMRNVWLGVSVENQATVDERIPPLLQTPAAIRFVSYLPALEAVDFGPWLSLPNFAECFNPRPAWNVLLDWIIAGGESGPGARPFDIEWAVSAVRQCEAAGVACFVKQLDAKPYEVLTANDLLSRDPTLTLKLPLRDRKGGDWDEWPVDLTIRQFPEVPNVSA